MTSSFSWKFRQALNNKLRFFNWRPKPEWIIIILIRKFNAINQSAAWMHGWNERITLNFTEKPIVATFLVYFSLRDNKLNCQLLITLGFTPQNDMHSELKIIKKNLYIFKPATLSGLIYLVLSVSRQNSHSFCFTRAAHVIHFN